MYQGMTHEAHGALFFFLFLISNVLFNLKYIKQNHSIRRAQRHAPRKVYTAELPIYTAKTGML